jgi:ATP-dependent Lon protease
LKTIKKELGMEHDEKDSLITKFQRRIAERHIPETVMSTVNEEVSSCPVIYSDSLTIWCPLDQQAGQS